MTIGARVIGMLLAGLSAAAQAAKTDELDVTMQVVEANGKIPDAVIHEIKLPKDAKTRDRKTSEPETVDVPRERYEGDAYTGAGDAPEKDQGPGDAGGSGPGGGMSGDSSSGSGPGGGMDGGHEGGKKRR